MTNKIYPTITTVQKYKKKNVKTEAKIDTLNKQTIPQTVLD